MRLAGIDINLLAVQELVWLLREEYYGAEPVPDQGIRIRRG